MSTLLAERYRLDRVAGHGGMAVVYEAFDCTLERRVAVKYFQTHLLHYPILLARFKREALAAGKIVHPNVVAIHDIGTGADERPFIVMEFVDGPTVASLVAQGPLAPARVAQLGAGIARGLAAAHALGFVHRDVKPANVLVADGDIAKLTDFGLVRADGDVAPDSLAAALTADGKVVGSRRFIAPEQVDEGRWSAASDCYALGASLYQMLSGDAGEERDIARVPTAFGSLLARMLAHDPQQRIGEASAVADELDAIARTVSER